MNASHEYLSIYLNSWHLPCSNIQIMKRKTLIKILSISQHAKHAKCDSWLSNNRFWLSTIIKIQRQACYMYWHMDPLYNQLQTRPIQTGREMSIELSPNRQFRFSDDPECQSSSGSVLNRTRTRSDSLELLQTLNTADCWAFIELHILFAVSAIMSDPSLQVLC